MSRVFARKNGRIYTVYSEPVESWESPPDDFLVNTYNCENDEQFKSIVGQDVAILDRPTSKENTGPRPSLANMLGVMAAMNLPKEAQDAFKKAREGAPVVHVQELGGGRVAEVKEAGLIQDKAILEYRLASARNSPNLTVIRKFILKLWPELARDLDLVDQLEKDEAL